MVTYCNIDVWMDEEKHLADVDECEISDGYKFVGYVCKVRLKNKIQGFHGYKQATILGFTTKFYYGDCKTIIEASQHETPLKELNK